MAPISRQRAAADAAIARIASRQHGIATVTQLAAAGITRGAIKHRLASARLHRVHRGIYAVGHAGLSREGRWMAAVLACGEGAVLSHRSAAELWEILRPAAGETHVTVRAGGGRSRRDGLRIHRSHLLSAAETTAHRRIPVTTPARTIADLHRTEPSAVVRAAVRQAEFLGLPLAGLATDGTRSELERRFLRLCVRHRLPRPEVNVRIGPYTVDFLWREPRLIVETDGYSAHRGAQAFEDDRARDVELRLRGYEVLRFTYRQLDGDPAGVAATVRTLLTAPPQR